MEQEGSLTAIELHFGGLHVARRGFLTTPAGSEVCVCLCLCLLEVTRLEVTISVVRMVGSRFSTVRCRLVSMTWKSLRKTLCDWHGLYRQPQRFAVDARIDETLRMANEEKREASKAIVPQEQTRWKEMYSTTLNVQMLV